MALTEQPLPTTVETIPASDITLTEKAAAELATLISENGKDGSLLRVWVAGGGCSGLSYGMALDENEPEPGDVVYTDRGIRVVVDDLSVRYMKGAVVDYVDDVLGGGFRSRTPTPSRAAGAAPPSPSATTRWRAWTRARAAVAAPAAVSKRGMSPQPPSLRRSTLRAKLP